MDYCDYYSSKVVSLKVYCLHCTGQGSHSHGKILENPGKKWSWKVMEKSWKIAKIQNVMEICLPGKSHGKVMEISCPNPLNRVPIVL